jgi:hypothetical protein
LIALSIWTVLESAGAVVGALLNGSNILRPQMFLAIGMACTAFILKWFLGGWIGVTGVVWATIIAYSTISIPGQIWLIKNFKQKAVI